MKKLICLALIAISILIFKADSASAQTCTTTPPTNTGTVTLSATATAGTYRVWARMKANSTTPGNNSFYLKINNGCAILVGDNSAISSSSWTWVDYQNGTTTNKIDTTLTAGTHVVTIIGNEAGVGVDKLLMTKNLSCVPTGVDGANCPAEIVATPTIGATDTTPPVISSINATSITQSQATINWKLDENASGQIEYGPTTAYGQSTTLQPCTSSDCQYNYHIQTLFGLTANTTYHYRVKSTDVAGNQAISNDCTFITDGKLSSAYCTTSPTKTIDASSNQITISNYNPQVNIQAGGQARLMTVTSKYNQTISFYGYPTSRGAGINYSGSPVSLTANIPTDITIEAISTVPAGNYSGSPIITTTYDQRQTSLPTVTVIVAASTPAPTKTPTPTPNPTNTPVPTAIPTIPPATTVLKFNSVKLHGIGNGGDNTNPNLAGNLSPIRTTRAVTVELIDSAGNTLPASSGNIVYKSTTGDFSGDIIVNSSIPTGTYLVKIKSPGYLKKQLTGIITVTAATSNTLPAVALVTGDANNDNTLSILDYNIIVDCYSDLLPAKNCSDANKKLSADLSDDGNVNANDYNLFLRELSVVSGN